MYRSVTLQSPSLQQYWPRLPATIRRDLLHILSEGLLHSAGDSPMLQHVQSLLVSLLETGTPEELQVQALRIIQIGLDPISRHDISRLLSGRESDRSSLTPQVINATLLRFIPKHPGSIGFERGLSIISCNAGFITEILGALLSAARDHCCFCFSGSRQEHGPGPGRA